MSNVRILPALLVVLLITTAGAADDSDLFTKTWPAVSLPEKRVVLSSKLVERVSNILVAEGDKVKKGALLIQLDDRVLVRQIEVAEASADFSSRIKASMARHQHLAREYDRLKKVTGGVSESQLDRAQTERDLASHDVEELRRQERAARLQVDYHKARLRDYRIASPLEGTAVVSSTWVEAGEMVDETQRLVELIEPRRVEVHVHVPERNLPLIHQTKRAEVQFGAVGDTTGYVAKVHFISPYVDSASGTFMVKLLLTLDEASIIKPGLGCSVRFFREEAPKDDAPAPAKDN